MPRLVCPSWRWMTSRGTPSRAISTACACRSWWGAKRRRTPERAAVSRSWARAAAIDQARPRVGPADHAEQRSDRQLDTGLQPRLELFPGPVVHADLAPAPALAAAYEHRSAPRIEVGLVERERFAVPQSCAPEDDDQAA